MKVQSINPAVAQNETILTFQRLDKALRDNEKIRTILSGLGIIFVSAAALVIVFSAKIASIPYITLALAILGIVFLGASAIKQIDVQSTIKEIGYANYQSLLRVENGEINSRAVETFQQYGKYLTGPLSRLSFYHLVPGIRVKECREKLFAKLLEQNPGTDSELSKKLKDLLPTEKDQVILLSAPMPGNIPLRLEDWVNKCLKENSKKDLYKQHINLMLAKSQENYQVISKLNDIAEIIRACPNVNSISLGQCVNENILRACVETKVNKFSCSFEPLDQKFQSILASHFTFVSPFWVRKDT